MQRREFLIASGIGFTLQALAGRAAAARLTAQGSSGQSLLIADRKLPEAVRAIEAATIRGMAVRPIEGDLTSLWYSELDERWRRKSEMVSGLTTSSVLFCMAQLAPDYGMTLIAHGPVSSDAVEVDPLYFTRDAMTSGQEFQGGDRLTVPIQPEQGAHWWVFGPKGRPIEKQLATSKARLFI